MYNSLQKVSCALMKQDKTVDMNGSLHPSLILVWRVVLVSESEAGGTTDDGAAGAEDDGEEDAGCWGAWEARSLRSQTGDGQVSPGVRFLSFCPVDSPTCSIDNLEMFYPFNFFVDLHSYGVLEQIQLCSPNGNFGQLSRWWPVFILDWCKLKRLPCVALGP